ncbi:cobalamin biosynthesis protein [Comamonas endophytica]|uniref:Cobalamin biosynthesis protein n=1 Tax=Comamonas endophytica TaxID=2949090 RepID=A0ABY6G714_9BURK|nr:MULTISPECIES: cobalamin biosynthesis protein [unclassified Acidovorax]MCD2511445.1 cobalamin biosynthesis protein [Acidovorax sp. D4N7]UYG50836.1 cobalamin biosynthesis protein [Acidovorax sp. 5MLIR]
MRPLFAGWGWRAAAQRQSFASCWAQACAQPSQGEWHFALLQSRRETPAWHEFEAWRSAAVPEAGCSAWPENAIASIDTPSASPRLVARFATGSVCEALALHAARQQGAQAHLLLRRIVSADRLATLAIAGLALPQEYSETGVHP